MSATVGIRTQSVLVTGASGFLGAAIARRLAGLGYRVWVHYGRSEAKACELIREIRAAGGSALGVQADLTQPADARRLFQRLFNDGGAYALVHAAAVNRPALLRFAKDEEFRVVLENNVVAAFRCVRESAAYMMSHGGGRIVLVGSLSSRAPMRGQVAYATSKAALLGLARAAALELEAYEVTVNVVSPGPLAGGMDQSKQTDITARDEVVRAVAWLLSSAGRSTTGLELGCGANGEVQPWFVPGSNQARQTAGAADAGR